MATKLSSAVFTRFIVPTCLLLFLYSTVLLLYTPSSTSKHSISFTPPCNLFSGHWVMDPNRRPMYEETCPFHRNAWNCLRNKRENMGRMNYWKWVPEKCELSPINPLGFMGLMRNKGIGFVGDSLNENFLVSFPVFLELLMQVQRSGRRRGPGGVLTFQNLMLQLLIIEPYCSIITSGSQNSLRSLIKMD
uniref:Trichome birefringence-like N-terminal domain-containing protein n=1 Tax=Davidia involucrata TaxID=16924 RepID=A0A5B7AMI8_DAVIN